ncbi:hypothetical protein CPB85DRAFT_1567979 [Mucidula mucida]|nr:hypothetical protein CPB85DRAFT_1567979 [Mucidula mucida]
MTDIFPPEIFDAILDYVHLLDAEAKSTYYAIDYSLRINSTKPVKTLLPCSLVCRSWVPRTRLHIFNAIHLPHYDGTIAATFGALVAHPLCTFRSHVRRLSLHERYGRSPSEALWMNSVLPQLALLTGVENVYIYHARFTDVAEEQWRAGLPLFGPHLKHLDIQFTQFDQVSRMMELVSRCTNLEHLALRYIDEDSDGAPKGSDTIVRTPPSRFLRSLALQSGIAMSAEFMTWLCPSPGSIKVPTVELRSISVENAHHVSRFLHDVGPSITSLAIGFSDSSFSSTDGQDAFCRVADLTTLTNLETLHFQGPLTTYPIHITRGLSAKHIPPILAKLGSPSLKEIRFHVSMKAAEDFEIIDWGSIVLTLNSARYPTLEVLSFRPIKEDVLEETKAWLDEHVSSKLRRNVEIRCATSY